MGGPSQADGPKVPSVTRHGSGDPRLTGSLRIPRDARRPWFHWTIGRVPQRTITAFDEQPEDRRRGRATYWVTPQRCTLMPIASNMAAFVKRASSADAASLP